MSDQEWKNKLYFGDNLSIMREQIADESVDLIYLDPPFNSQATYNVLFGEKDGSRSQAQITAFEDTWHWGEEAEATYHEIVTGCAKRLADVIQAFRSFLGQNDLMAYLTMMAIRLDELRRVLKPSGSIYLHCDHTASHYLKLLMDAIFGMKHFRNEIYWYYTNKIPDRRKKLFTQSTDTLLFYALGDYTFTVQEEQRDKPIRVSKMKKVLGKKVYVRGSDGKVEMITRTTRMVDNVWKIPLLHAQRERLGYPTQKPEDLLERVILTSSKPEDIILDPFCGCGTTIVAAEALGRRWIGVDITHLAVALMRYRLNDAFGPELSPYEVLGTPEDLAGARALAELDRYQFEWWALSLVEARPAQDKKKGADTGIDGYINFFDDNSGKAKKIIVQVKSGHVSVGMIRDLKGVLDREKATIGVFITLNPPTKPMKDEALSAGSYSPEYLAKQHTAPRIQIATIAELLAGAQIQYPRMLVTTFRRAERKYKEPRPTQEELL